MSEADPKLKLLVATKRPCELADLNDKVSIELLLEWSLDEQFPRLAFHSAWALEHLLKGAPSLLMQKASQVQQQYLQSTNWSVLRSYSKLMMVLTADKVWLDDLKEADREDILEKTLALVDQVDCPIAVKVNCWDILSALVSVFSWLGRELQLQIQLALEKNPSPALKSRGIRILKRLY